MNQRNSTIELSRFFQSEIRQGRGTGKSFKKIRYRQYCFLIRAILMVKKKHENLKHTVIKHLLSKIKKYSHVQAVITDYSKHVSDFISNNSDTFMELLPNRTTHFTRHETILTFSESYW